MQNHVNNRGYRNKFNFANKIEAISFENEEIAKICLNLYVYFKM